MNPLLFCAGLAGFLIVALGAFGAHGLEGKLSFEALDWWKTATLYGLVHAAAALAVALRGEALASRSIRISGWAFLAGVIVFSGSLYAMALGAPRFLGAVTPIGGLSFLAGWALTAVAGVRTR